MTGPGAWPPPRRPRRAPRPAGPRPSAGTTNRVTEAQVLTWLHTHRYAGPSHRHGNGPRWVFATHVKSASGFDAARVADAIAVDLWPSTGNAVHGHEVKVSRADWLAELRHPEKHQPIAQFCDHWWLVVPDRAIVKPGELPDGWGLLVVGPDAARAVRTAPRRGCAPMPRTFTAALLRAAVRTETRRNTP